MCDENTPAEVLEAAQAATLDLLPKKSRQQYVLTYRKFKDWCNGKKVENVTENVCLAYFSERANHIKPSSLWSEYSMVRALLLVDKNVEMKSFPKLTAFLKRQSTGYQCKKARVFSKKEIYKFFDEAPNQRYLMMKVGIYNLILLFSLIY